MKKSISAKRDTKPGDRPPTIWALAKSAAVKRNKPITLAGSSNETKVR